jgi:hypothetical protein
MADNKAGRNDPCPCGSGTKYKKCCWEKDHKRVGNYQAIKQGLKQKGTAAGNSNSLMGRMVDAMAAGMVDNETSALARLKGKVKHLSGHEEEKVDNLLIPLEAADYTEKEKSDDSKN